MSLNRRQFIKNATIGSAAIIGGTAMLKGSAFAEYPAPAASDVSFVGGSASYAGGRRQMIKDVLKPFQSVIAAGITGKRIIIKPNILGGSGARAALGCTHVDAVRGLIDFLRTVSPNVPITIADASSGSTTAMYDLIGYTALTTEYSGITLMDLNNSTTFPAATRHLWKADLTGTLAVNVSSAFLDQNNYIIDICRPKTHDCMITTALTKNMSMGMPLTSSTAVYSGNSKAAMHTVASGGTGAGEDRALAYNIFQLASQYSPLGFPNFSILDAWEGMEGEGPMFGTSSMQYCAVASADMLAADRLAAKLMGFSDTSIYPQPKPAVTPSYTDMRYLVWMSNAHFGNYDLSKINFIQGTLADLTTFVKNYKLHTHYSNSPYYETAWADTSAAARLGPATILDTQLPSIAIQSPTA